MTPAVGLAGIAGALIVVGVWEALAAIEGIHAMSRLLELAESAFRAGRAGHVATAPERRRLALLGSGALCAAGWLVLGPLAGALLGLGGPWLALRLLHARRRRHVCDLELDAPAVARAVADALSGGHSVSGAVVQAARGAGAGAAGVELRAAASAIALGDSLERALERMQTRAPGPGFQMIVAAILLQRRAGGDLPRALRGVADAVEERERLERDARGATAQARFTGGLVCSLPALVAALAELSSPGYLVSVLRSPLAASLAGCALTFQLAALVAIRRLARVDA